VGVPVAEVTGIMLARPMKEAMMRRFLTVLAVLLGLCATSGFAQAQEIQLTGPLAGAPAVRQLRLRRQGRFEIAPQISFTLLDEYQRSYLLGAQLNYNITDWLAIGIWAAPGALYSTTGLTDHIQEVTQMRRGNPAGNPYVEPNVPPANISTNNRLTAASIGPQFKNQLGTIKYVYAPEITLVPFRGKLAIFQKIFVDADAYVFVGPAFVGIQERKDCGDTGQNVCQNEFGTSTRTQITGTFGLGLKFYMNQFLSLGLEWRALPFPWNTGGFDTHGGGPDEKFPDTRINSKDREFKFNQLLSVNIGLQIPFKVKSSE
jgi:outer membrane beta-barrel protein